MREDLFEDTRQMGTDKENIFRIRMNQETGVGSLLRRFQIGIGHEGRTVVEQDRLVQEKSAYFFILPWLWIHRYRPGQMAKRRLRTQHRKIGSITRSSGEVIRRHIGENDQGKRQDQDGDGRPSQHSLSPCQEGNGHGDNDNHGPGQFNTVEIPDTDEEIEQPAQGRTKGFGSKRSRDPSGPGSSGTEGKIRTVHQAEGGQEQHIGKTYEPEPHDLPHGDTHHGTNQVKRRYRQGEKNREDKECQIQGPVRTGKPGKYHP